MNVYKPDEYTISIGIPSALVESLNLPFPTSIEIRDWVSITSNKPIQRFQFSTGIFGEPFVEMNRNSSRVYDFAILQSSPDIFILGELLRLQTFGEVGFPFAMFDNSAKVNTGFLKDLKQKSLYPVAYIVDEPTESWALTGATWVYKIQLIAGMTVYI
jgi:hypothetical protein